MSKKKDKIVPAFETPELELTVNEAGADAVELSANEVSDVADVVVPEKKKPTAQRIIGIVINVVLVLAIILAAMATYVSFATTSGNAPSVFGLRLHSVQTQSMEPTISKGDLIVSKAVKNPKDLKRGDIITYWTVIEGERVLNTHRIVSISEISPGVLAFTTQGDNNTTPDSQYVHQKDVIGTYSFKMSGVGKVFDYLQTSTGFLVVVVVPVMIFLLYQLIQFFRVLFEYQNVKNRIKFEMERGRTEDLIAEQEQSQAAERQRIEAELREKLRAELMAEQNTAESEQQNN